MKKKIIFCAFLLFGHNLFLWGQQKITFETGKMPPGKVLNVHLFLAGDFNNWNPADSGWELKAGAAGRYVLLKNLPVGL